MYIIYIMKFYSMIMSHVLVFRSVQSFLVFVFLRRGERIWQAEGERILNRLHSQHRACLWVWSHDSEIRTWAKIKSDTYLTNWATQLPPEGSLLHLQSVTLSSSVKWEEQQSLSLEVSVRIIKHFTMDLMLSKCKINLSIIIIMFNFY